MTRLVTVRAWTWVAVVGVAWLVGCATEPQRGTLSGTVTVRCPDDVTAASTVAGSATIVAGEIVVRFRDAARPTPALLALDGVAAASRGIERAHQVARGAVPGSAVYRIDGLDAADTVATAAALARRPDVAYAEPNLWLHPTALPSDPLYALQWHYGALNLSEAWEVTTGSPDVVVAIVDTGILADPARPSRTHPDLVGRVLPGADTISRASTAGDGDGRDTDPYDVGDDPCGTSTFHGTHVAGTIGASSNDGVGVAGVDWQAGLLPVRALGIGGGTVVDVADGVAWAAGLEVEGLPTNVDHPADVINLSLGGPGTCSSYFQEVIDRVQASFPSTVIVAAAGNAGRDLASSPFLPASCDGVIAVGATDRGGGLAWYSNYGTRVDVMAPGGDTTDDDTDGVYSLGVDPVTLQFTWTWNQGTSMAAPHVSGAAALIAAVDPSLGLEGTLALLTSTARPLSPEECPPGPDACGAGLIDVAAAVQAAASATAARVDPAGGASRTRPTTDRTDRAVRTVETSATFAPASLAAPFDGVPAVVLAVPEGSSVDDGPHVQVALDRVPTSYALVLPAGRYCPMVWRDDNDDDVLNAGDGFGRTDEAVEVVAGAEIAGVTIVFEAGSIDLDGTCAP